MDWIFLWRTICKCLWDKTVTFASEKWFVDQAKKTLHSTMSNIIDKDKLTLYQHNHL